MYRYMDASVPGFAVFFFVVVFLAGSTSAVRARRRLQLVLLLFTIAGILTAAFAFLLGNFGLASLAVPVHIRVLAVFLVH